jgi:chitodextrinase
MDGGGSQLSAGESVYLKAGTYTGRFYVNTNGSSSGRIVYRSAPGQKAVLLHNLDNDNDNLIIRGSWNDVRDIEVTVTSTNRALPRGSGIGVEGDHNRAINNFIHDTGCGIRSPTSATNSEIYGNIIINTGSTDQSVSCHSLYVANAPGAVKMIENNTWFGSGWYGLHAYTEGGSLSDLTFKKNSGLGTGLIGGFIPLDNIEVDDNDIEGIQFGQEAGKNATHGDFNIHDNRLYGGYKSLQFVGKFTDSRVRVANNRILGPNAIEVTYDCTYTPSTSSWTGNTFYGTSAMYYGSGPGTCPGASINIPTRASGNPPDQRIVRVNKYQNTRATVVVHNFSGASTVSLSHAEMADPDNEYGHLNLANGDHYELRYAFNYGGSPVSTGTYNGTSITLPMAGLVPATPTGNWGSAHDPSLPEFAVFILCKDSCVNGSTSTPTTPPADTTAPTVPTSLTGSATSSTAVSLSWTASTDAVGATGYRIYRNGVQIGTSTSTSYSDSGLVASTAYSYTVSAVDAAGNQSAQSSARSVTTNAAPPAADTTPPSTPTGLTGSATSQTQITTSWTASTDNVGVVNYIIYRNGTQVGTSTNTQDTDTGLTANTTYAYTVRAVDAAGNLSATSTAVNIKTQAATPTNPIDFNNDGRVDGVDISILATSLFTPGPKTPQQGDLSGDGLVTALDLSLFSSEFCEQKGTCN